MEFDEMTQELPTELTYEYFLAAGDTDAQGRMPIWLIISRVIEVATYHANILGIGYDQLIQHNITWVLTRLSIVMTRYPRINETYHMTTWIEGYNRLYSDRCFMITDSYGNEIGHIRSMWVAIDLDKRTAADLTELNVERFKVSERKCPVRRAAKMPPLSDDTPAVTYTWQYSDIDVNRHVNTVQYVKHILNQWDMAHYDSHQIERFDIAFHHECHYGDTATIRHADISESLSQCEIIGADGHLAIQTAITWQN